MKLSFHFGLLDFRCSVGLLGRVISSSQGLYLYTNTEKRTYTQTPNIHVLSGIRTHNPDFRVLDRSATVTSISTAYIKKFLSTLLFSNTYNLHSLHTHTSLFSFTDRIYTSICVYKILVGKPEGKKLLQDLVVDLRIILKLSERKNGTMRT
jgi:hypothetical protein